MRGKISGFETRLRKAVPHLLDIDGDICHHVHNVVKKFTSFFGKVVENLLDDIYIDFKYSPDLRTFLKKIYQITGVTYNTPKQRVCHRWLSVLDCTLPMLEMMPAFTLIYSSWLSKQDISLYKDESDKILKRLSNQSKKLIEKIKCKMQQKKLTKQGAERKARIVKSLFFRRNETLLYINLYVEILPIFKSFILTFEQKEPLVHRIYDEQIELVKTILTCFIKPKMIKNITGEKLKFLNLKDKKMYRHSNYIYLGSNAEKYLSRILIRNPDFKSSFLKTLLKAYLESSVYLLNKLPFNNPLLKCLSAIDPMSQGHEITERMLKKLNFLSLCRYK
nr:uncharacterized protein LOC124818745 isoform X1 [Hydra vulgaris]